MREAREEKRSLFSFTRQTDEKCSASAADDHLEVVGPAGTRLPVLGTDRDLLELQLEVPGATLGLSSTSKAAESATLGKYRRATAAAVLRARAPLPGPPLPGP